MVDFGGIVPDLPIEPGFNPPAEPRVKLVPTAQGIQPFEISFTAGLPNNLSLCLEYALAQDPQLLEPVDPRVIALHGHIHRALAPCMPTDRPDLIAWHCKYRVPRE